MLLRYFYNKIERIKITIIQQEEKANTEQKILNDFFVNLYSEKLRKKISYFKNFYQQLLLSLFF